MFRIIYFVSNLFSNVLPGSCEAAVLQESEVICFPRFPLDRSDPCKVITREMEAVTINTILVFYDISLVMAGTEEPPDIIRQVLEGTRQEGGK